MPTEEDENISKELAQFQADQPKNWVEHRYKTQNKVGPPIKLTDEIIEKIRVALMHGAYIETAVAYAGVKRSTFYHWLKVANQAKDPDTEEEINPIYSRLLDTIEKTQADQELLELQKLNQFAEKNWQVIAWKLERKYPKKWGRKTMLKLEDDNSGKKESGFNEDTIQAEISKAVDQLESEDRWE